jgi:hypothetical protein
MGEQQPHPHAPTCWCSLGAAGSRTVDAMNKAFSKQETPINDVGIVHMIYPSQSYQTVH